MTLDFLSLLLVVQNICGGHDMLHPEISHREGSNIEFRVAIFSALSFLSPTLKMEEERKRTYEPSEGVNNDEKRLRPG